MTLYGLLLRKELKIDGEASICSCARVHVAAMNGTDEQKRLSVWKGSRG